MFLIDKALFKLMCRFMLCSFVLPCIYDCAAVVFFFLILKQELKMPNGNAKP